ncbi:MAG: histidinol dehydrogenase, partial [Candidatus Omnitrophota bacterium]|nr:histidinol dehydrogenase [Candidatus Omnitrophota bacterium]
MKIIKLSGKQFAKLRFRNLAKNRRIRSSVEKIINSVRQNGDDAILKYTRKFDNVKLAAKELKVSERETNGAYQDISPDFVTSLRDVIDNISKFYKKQLKKSWKMRDADGVLLGEKYQPLDTVGVYVPSGTVPLISSVYMTVLPARIAGVKRIVLVTPPNKYKSVDPHILVVANLLKVDEIYKVGGAQAIAALAFGTKTIPNVDKIVGPGNQYVNEAKRQVFGYCGIDMIAGPSEVVVLANQHSNFEYVKADLLAQAEHHMGLSVLVTTSRKLAKIMKKEVEKGYIIIAKNIDEAVEIINKLAPEHLEIQIKSPRKVLKRIRNAGAVFVGPYSPTA